MSHDLIPGDQHFKRMPGNLDYCQCWAPCCFDVTTLDCLCKDGCDCRTKSSAVIPVRKYPEDRPPTTQEESSELRPTSKSGSALTSVSSPQRTCEECGNPVIRNGTRGRYPKLCPSCKSK